MGQCRGAAGGSLKRLPLSRLMLSPYFFNTASSWYLDLAILIGSPMYRRGDFQLRKKSGVEGGLRWPPNRPQALIRWQT